MEKDKLYIAYGSNLNVKQMKCRCPTATIVGISQIKDFELVFRGSKTGSYATIESCEGSIVPVLIWKIKLQDEYALDRYEGYPDFYQKGNITMELDGQSVSALIYLMPDTHTLGMPSLRYVNTILDGYDSAGFDCNILYEAVKHTEQRIADEPEEKQDMFEMKWW